MALSMQSDQSLVDTWLNILAVFLRLLLALLSIYRLLSLFFFGDQTLPNQQRILSSLDFGDLRIRSGIFISLVNEFIITLIVNVFKSWHFILGFLFKAIYGLFFRLRRRQLSAIIVYGSLLALPFLLLTVHICILLWNYTS